jgi:predicted transcriptional regulator
MTKDEQRSAAKDLFMLGRDQQVIARTLAVSQTTMTKWAKDGNWREERARKNGMHESISARILTLIDYQIEALEELTKDHRSSGKLKLLDKGEIDALSKLFATIKGKDISWSQYVNVTKELIEFLSERDNELAKLVVEHTDYFLLHKRDLIVA